VNVFPSSDIVHECVMMTLPARLKARSIVRSLIFFAETKVGVRSPLALGGVLVISSRRSAAAAAAAAAATA
jgi:hypothetical protein